MQLLVESKAPNAGTSHCSASARAKALRIIGEHDLGEMVGDVQDSPVLGLIGDESTAIDATGKLACGVLLLDKKGRMNVIFVSLTDLKGDAGAENITRHMSTLCATSAV